MNQPRALVKLLAGLTMPGTWRSLRYPWQRQSWMAKYWILMCWERSVGFIALIMQVAEMLSSKRRVGLYWAKLICWRTRRRYLATLAAEAAARNLIVADAQNLYETGVALAFNYWNTEIPVDYLIGNAAFNAAGTTAVQQIITQKWIANVINGYEGWVEYRRTGFPELGTISASFNNDLIPVRMPYPAEEDALNNENYTIAAVATDDNSINVKVWWNE